MPSRNTKATARRFERKYKYPMDAMNNTLAKRAFVHLMKPSGVSQLRGRRAMNVAGSLFRGERASSVRMARNLMERDRFIKQMQYGNRYKRLPKSMKATVPHTVPGLRTVYAASKLHAHRVVQRARKRVARKNRVH